MKKNFLFAGIAVLLSVSLTSCGLDLVRNEDTSSLIVPTQSSSSSSTEESDATTITELTLPIFASDSFNPFRAQSLTNLSLMTLLYDSLTRMSPEGALEYLLAESVEVSGTTVTVTLRQGISFSDGSALRPADVVYSLNQAKAGGHYASRLSNMASAAVRGNAVVITLFSPDSLFAYQLDIPIIKENSGTDTGAIGSGRYIYTKENGNQTLIYNTGHFQHQVPIRFQTIHLTTVPDLTTMESSVRMGQIDCLYSDNLSKSVSVVGGETVNVSQNRLLFAAVNGSDPITSKAEVRQAISAAADREEILDHVYNNNGTTAYMPERPEYGLGDLPESFRTGTEAADVLLDQAGYTEKDQYNIRKNGENSLALEILVPADAPYKILAANTLSEQLHRCGIKVTVTQTTAEDYAARIAAGQYQIYIGEMVQENNCSISAFLPGGSLSSGLVMSNEFLSAYQSFLNDTNNYSTFAEVFSRELPFIPLAYGDALLFHSKNLKSEIRPSATDPYYNIAEWN